MELIQQFKQNYIRHPLWMSDIYEEKDMIHLKEMRSDNEYSVLEYEEDAYDCNGFERDICGG